MKNFDLKACGVSEMSTLEAEKVNGGFWHFVVAYVIVEIILNPVAHYNAFMDGYNSFK